MPVYVMSCGSCLKEIKKLVRGKLEPVTCVCGAPMYVNIPSTVSSITREIKDPYRGVSHIKGQDKMVKKRMSDHHDRHEVEAKIDEHGIDDARKHGWTKKVKRV